MRCPSILPVLLSASSLVAQGAPEGGLCLDDRLERPLLYVRLEPAVKEARAPDWMRHPVLASLDSRLDTDGGLPRMLGDLAARAAGPVEIAWTGTLPARAGTDQVDCPLLLFRARLDAEDTARMGELLRSGEIATRHRTVGGHDTYLLSHDGEEQERPGSRIEVVLSGNDLLVSNHGHALEEVLGAVELRGPALAADPDFTRLRALLDPGPGAALVFADARQLLRRTGWDLSRLPLPRNLLAVVEPKPRGLAATMILDSGSPAAPTLSLEAAPTGELRAALTGEGGLVLSMAGRPPRIDRGGRGAGSRTGRGSGHRFGGAPLEAWEQARRALGSAMRFERRGEASLLRFVPAMEWDERLAALLEGLTDPHADALGVFGVSLPLTGGQGVLRLAGTVESATAADGTLRVRAICTVD